MRGIQRVKLGLSALALTLAAVGCVQEAEPEAIDGAKVASLRAALPQQAILTAPLPASSAGASGQVGQPLVGETALYPAMATPLVRAVNGSVVQMIGLLERIVALPPTQFNEAEQAAVWGPFNNDDGFGQVAVVIQDHGEERDEAFRFTYVFGRMVASQPDSFTVVISGGATPDSDNDDFGAGAILWDFEANAAFEETHNPSPGALDRGRFVTLFEKQASEDDPDAISTMVLATFRNFVPKDNVGSEPIDLDYFYGNHETAEHTFDFLNYETVADVNPENGEGTAEDLAVRMIFLDQGQGRAEVLASGGDLDTEPGVDGVGLVECWNDAVVETYLGIAAFGPNGEVVGSEEDGQISDCGPIFAQDLDTLGVPALSDVDQSLLAALDLLAENGLP